jgi:RNA polymerase subunit RPABC4/transcription elongation factor Spt4
MMSEYYLEARVPAGCAATRALVTDQKRHCPQTGTLLKTEHWYIAQR